jgi:hypothetical protein
VLDGGECTKAEKRTGKAVGTGWFWVLWSGLRIFLRRRVRQHWKEVKEQEVQVSAASRSLPGEKPWSGEKSRKQGQSSNGSRHQVLGGLRFGLHVRVFELCLGHEVFPLKVLIIPWTEFWSMLWPSTSLLLSLS